MMSMEKFANYILKGQAMKNKVKFLPFVFKKHEIPVTARKISFFDFSGIFEKQKNKSFFQKLLPLPAISFLLQIWVILTRYLFWAIFIFIFSIFFANKIMSDTSYYAAGVSVLSAFYLFVKLPTFNNKQFNVWVFVGLILSLIGYTFRVRYHIFNISDFAANLIFFTAYFYAIFWFIHDFFIESNFLRFYFEPSSIGSFYFEKRTKKLSVSKKLFAIILIGSFAISSFFLVKTGYLLTQEKIKVLNLLKSPNKGASNEKQ